MTPEERIDAALPDIRHLVEDNRTLRYKLTNATTKLKRAGARIEELKAFNPMAIMQNEVANDRAVSLNDQLSKARGRIAELEEENARLKTKVEAMRDNDFFVMAQAEG